MTYKCVTRPQWVKGEWRIYASVNVACSAQRHYLNQWCRNWSFWEQISVITFYRQQNFNQKFTIYIQENQFEYVFYRIAGILSSISPKDWLALMTTISDILCRYPVTHTNAGFTCFWHFNTLRPSVAHIVNLRKPGPRISGNLTIWMYFWRGRIFSLYLYSHIRKFAFPYQSSNLGHQLTNSFT